MDLTITLDNVANDDTGDGDTFTEVESVSGGEGNDRLVGDDGQNCLAGEAGNDRVEGLGEADSLDSGARDRHARRWSWRRLPRGENPNEAAVADVYIGGPGVDGIELASASCDVMFTSCVARDVTVTLDDQPNDGAAGEGDDVRSDVEDVDIFGLSLGFAAYQGLGQRDRERRVRQACAPGAGTTRSSPGRERPVDTGDGDDTVNARDGFTDRIDCSDGADTANVDQLDVVTGCETVNRETVAVALEDLPPGLTLRGRGPGRPERADDVAGDAHRRPRPPARAVHGRRADGLQRRRGAVRVPLPAARRGRRAQHADRPRPSTRPTRRRSSLARSPCRKFRAARPVDRLPRAARERAAGPAGHAHAGARVPRAQ